MARTLAAWQALKPAYRSRLEKRGITADRYTSGASLAGARGHAQTPERPERAARNPVRYAAYQAKRTGIVPQALPGTVTVEQAKKHIIAIVKRAVDGNYLTSINGPTGTEENEGKIDYSGFFIKQKLEANLDSLGLVASLPYDELAELARQESLKYWAGLDHVTTFFYHAG